MDTRKPLYATLVASSVSFVILAWWALSGRSTGFDMSIREAVHNLASVPLTRVMQAITMLGSQWCLLPLCAILMWRLLALGRRRHAILVPAVCLGAELITQLLKLFLHRLRPPVFFGLLPAETYSFPSGHAFLSTVTYGLLASMVIAVESSRRSRIVMVTMAVVLPLLVGFSRVYLGYHYPSDILGGWAAALAWLSALKLTFARD